jgi:sugar phosphate isomerase/epimerase
VNVSDAFLRDAVSRRAFLVDLAAAGLGVGVFSACRRGGPAGGPIAPSVARIGLQLYTVRDQLQQDFEGTLERLARIGYTQMEFAGYYDRTPEQVRALLDRLRLASPSAHIGPQLLRQDVQGQITSAKTIGQQYITIPSYNFGREPKADAFKAAAAEFNKWGEQCRARGVRLAFHNHSVEFTPVGDGMTGMDVMLRETDPALVDYELDLYWTRFAGADPLQLFARYPGRFTMWHVKDLRDTAGQKTMTPVGEGTIDFRSIFAQARQSGLRHFFVEHDTAAQSPGGSLASVERSFTNLKGMLP